MFLTVRSTLLALALVAAVIAARPAPLAAAPAREGGLLVLAASEIEATPKRKLSRPGNSRKDDGAECRVDSNCESRKCRAFPDGKTYCLAEDRRCVVPAANGANLDTRIKIGAQCYQCVAQMGWQPCSNVTDASPQQQGLGKRLGQNMGQPQGQSIGQAQGGGLGRATQPQQGAAGR